MFKDETHYKETSVNKIYQEKLQIFFLSASLPPSLPLPSFIPSSLPFFLLCFLSLFLFFGVQL